VGGAVSFGVPRRKQRRHDQRRASCLSSV
jgi:hypothetical protein